MALFVGDTTSGEAEADARDHGPARFEDWSSVPLRPGQVSSSPRLVGQPTCTESSWLAVGEERLDLAPASAQS